MNGKENENHPYAWGALRRMASLQSRLCTSSGTLMSAYELPDPPQCRKPNHIYDSKSDKRHSRNAAILIWNWRIAAGRYNSRDQSRNRRSYSEISAANLAIDWSWSTENSSWSFARVKTARDDEKFRRCVWDHVKVKSWEIELKGPNDLRCL